MSQTVDHTRSLRSSIICWLSPLSFFPISKTFSISTGSATSPSNASSSGQPRRTTPLSMRYWVTSFSVHFFMDSLLVNWCAKGKPLQGYMNHEYENLHVSTEPWKIEQPQVKKLKLS